MDRASLEWAQSMMARMVGEQQRAALDEEDRARLCYPARRCRSCKEVRSHVLFALLIDHKSVKMISHEDCLYCRKARKERDETAQRQAD